MADVNASTRIVENEAGQIAPAQDTFIDDDLSSILDRTWVQNAFLVPDSGFTDPTDQANRYYSTANMKFTDTRLGCSIGINPRPQYCQYSDVPVPGRLTTRNDPSISDFSGNYGMGRQYSEFIDDSAQRISMSFGVPQFNSLFGFLTAAYESNQMTLARTGRASSVFYKAGMVVGTGALFAAFPLTSIAIGITKLVNAFISRPTSKFYTLKPTPHLYWSAVNQLVNSMAINRGIMPRYLNPDQQSQTQGVGRPFKLDEEYLELLTELMPGVFRKAPGTGTFTFDMYAISCYAQVIAGQLFKQEYEQLDSGTSTDYYGYVKKEFTGAGPHATRVSNADGSATIGAKLDTIFNVERGLEGLFQFMSGFATWLSDSPDDYSGIEADMRAGQKGTDDKNTDVTVNPRAESEGPNFGAYMDAMIHDGSLFATFIVDHTGPQSESWSNAVTESELARKLNGIVNDMSSARFSLAEGNVIGGIPGMIAGAAVGAVKDLAVGTLNGITGGLGSTLAGLAGAGYIDIPKHWDSSQFQATRSNYTMQLISPYGNPISQMMAIDIPLAMLMAGALPRSTGKASYTAPFLCQIFDRGRCQIRLGMIDQLSFTRGTSHLSFGDFGNAMAVDVSFSVIDLSSIMHMPIATGLLGSIDIAQDEDNVLMDYLAVLAGQSIETQIYPIPKARLAFAKKLAGLSKVTSSAYWASTLGGSTGAEIMRYFTRASATIDPTGLSSGL